MYTVHITLMSRQQISPYIPVLYDMHLLYLPTDSGAHPTTSNSAKTDAKNPDLLIELFILLGNINSL